MRAGGGKARVALAVAPAAAYMALIFVLSSRPPPRAVVDLGVSDRWLHLVEYGALGFLLARVAAVRTGSRAVRVLLPLPSLLGALYGLGDEWHQSFVPGRDASAADLAMDAVGSLLGATACALLLRWPRRR